MYIHRIAAFTDQGRGGNPAGVVLADQLPSSADMQQVAAEVGYSETVFACPEGEGAWRVRYYSPEAEVAFCGHATIALGAVLGQTLGAGTYPLVLARDNIDVSTDNRTGEWISILRSPPTHSVPARPALLSEALDLFGYARSDLDPTLAPCEANGGIDHLIIPLGSRAALARMDYDLGQGRSFMQTHGIGTVAFVFRGDDRLFHARNAFAIGGVFEDPATGAAAAAFAGMLRDLHALESGTITIMQGEDMGQPCRIEVGFTAELGSPVNVRGTSSISPPSANNPLSVDFARKIQVDDAP
ncbi:PhzF family phenazine biosynthesis protein [Agrobacterium pusense]|uniref:PhzF family phenazine biosynthesis protein n=1 Tax=Agrobacterium pusense TaxID=648995 RepID=UPI00285C3D3C|nr:PhzF family phenazine biosynthesis isomerase [Agrobacterium pusense]MDR6192902.1 PhzF family phenazine biosynthesis protein [Agrobacterium pusense]